MAPTREWLNRNQIEEIIDRRVEKLFAEYTRTVDGRLNGQDLVLNSIRTTQENFHVENRRRLDSLEADTKKILQYHTADDEMRRLRLQQQDDRDKKWDRWKVRITVVAAIVTIFSMLGIFNYLHHWYMTGQLFPLGH